MLVSTYKNTEPNVPMTDSEIKRDLTALTGGKQFKIVKVSLNDINRNS